MIRNDVILLLTQLLGPLKMQPQEEESQFIKFQDILIQALTQPSLEFRKNGIEFPGLQTNRLPDDVGEELNNMTDKIVMLQANRSPTDPVFWLRQRDKPLIGGIEENVENFNEPAFSFGPFFNSQMMRVWFDFFQVHKQLRFNLRFGGIPDYLVITLPMGSSLPAQGSYEAINFEDCTIWICAKTIAENGNKKYVGIRAKNCVMNFPLGITIVPTDGLMVRFSPTFTLSFEPFDKFVNEINNNPKKAAYPGKVILSFSGKKWSLQSIDKSTLNLNGDTLEFEQSGNIAPVFLEPENLIHFPLTLNKASWEIINNDTERFQLGGKAGVTDSGWYLPVISIDNNAGIGMLGMNGFSGYLGFRGTEGLTLNWPGIENGKLTINKFLLQVRPGRMNLRFTYNIHRKIKQQFLTWKAGVDTESFSSVDIKPLSGTGICISDVQNMEALIQPVIISAIADRPLNSNQKRFQISDFQGAVEFIKIEGKTSIFLVGGRFKPTPGEAQKKQMLQSLCLRNALLTTGDPTSIFIKGQLLNNEILTEGFLGLKFSVYKIVNTLPDPYISNQDEIFDLAEVARFNELWRSGADTLPEQFRVTMFSITHWDKDGISLQFNLHQSVGPDMINNDKLLQILVQSVSPCGGAIDESYNNEEIRKLIRVDAENVLGAHGFLRLLPGDRCLVDVSDRQNRWGVSFSNRISNEGVEPAANLGYNVEFPFSIKNMDFVSSGRMSRLFTLPHIQWEPVMKIENPLLPDDANIPSIINFSDNGAPTRVSSAQKNEVALVPRNLYNFIIEGYNRAIKPQAMAAHFSLPFGICAFAYFNPTSIENLNLPNAKVRGNEPAFSGKKTGEIRGAMQLHVEAIPPKEFTDTDKDNHHSYFIGAAIQKPANNNILGNDISTQFNQEFSQGGSQKVPLQRIDFSGYGASIFSNWLDESANYGAVSQVAFDVLIGRTAHEVIQIKSILFPWGVPVVRSIVIERKNTGIVTRYDSGWVAQGPGEFDFRSHVVDGEINPYNFHPGTVKGIYNVREIRNVPKTMDIPITNAKGQLLRFSGVYFNGDLKIENILTGALPHSADGPYSMIHSAGQFGYVMLANPADIKTEKTLANLFPANKFKELLTDPKIRGNLGGPVNAVMNIAATDQRMQVTRVDVSASNEAVPAFVVAVRGTVSFPREGSWTVVKCLASKDVVPLNAAEAVPLIRNGLLDPVDLKTLHFADSHHSIGDPSEIDKYTLNAAKLPSIQYSFLQTTGSQKLLFRKPTFFEKEPKQVFHEVPELADAFRLLKCKTIFPNLSGTLSLPANVKSLIITGDGNGLKFPDEFFSGIGNLNDFVPPQLTKDLTAKEFELVNVSGLQIIISYSSKEEMVGNESRFGVDLSSDAVDEAPDAERKKWQTINKDVAIKVNLGQIKPLLTLRGTFRSEAGKVPEFENPQCELGDELKAVKDILQILALLAGKAQNDNLKVVMGNSPGVYNYKMSIDQNIPVIQFPSVEQITLSTPPPLIIEASLSLGIFFNLSLSPDPENLIKPGAGAVFGFEGMIQIQLITIGVAAAYGVGITKVKAYVDFTDPKPIFEFIFGFGATVIVNLPVVGLASVTRSFSLGGNIESGNFKVVAGQMLRGVLSLAGGLLIVSIQIEGSAGVERKDKVSDDPKTTAIFQMIFSLDVSLAFVISYDFEKKYTEEIALN